MSQFNFLPTFKQTAGKTVFSKARAINTLVNQAVNAFKSHLPDGRQSGGGGDAGVEAGER